MSDLPGRVSIVVVRKVVEEEVVGGRVVSAFFSFLSLSASGEPRFSKAVSCVDLVPVSRVTQPAQ